VVGLTVARALSQLATPDNGSTPGPWE
jgi:hypothetical protein